MSSGFISYSWGVLSWQVQHLPPARHGFNSRSANFPACAQITFYGAWWLLVVVGFAVPRLPVPLGPKHCSRVQDATLFWAKGKMGLRPSGEQWCLPLSGKLSFFKANHPFYPLLAHDRQGKRRGCCGGSETILHMGPAGVNPALEPARAEGTVHSQWH